MFNAGSRKRIMRFRSEIIPVFLSIGFISSSFYILFKGSICLFINIFGIPCPTCGITRAFISLINFNFKEAFRFHPLFWIVPLIPFVWKVKYKFYGVFILFILFWIIRMYLYFPNIEPMIFNKNAIFIRLLTLIIQRLNNNI